MTVYNLTALPSGSRIFVDTNIFSLHFSGQSVSCTALIQRITFGQVEAFVNSRVLLDLIHKLMLKEAEGKNYISRARASELRAWLSGNRSNGALLSDYHSYFEKVLELGLRYIHTTEKLLVDTKSERETHGVMAGDSLHLGCMRRRSIANIVTNDGDFDHISHVNIWKPLDVIL